MSITGTTTIGIHFGPLADPIEKQLNEQGFTLNGDGVSCCSFIIIK